MRFPEYLSKIVDEKNDLIKISRTIYGFSSRIAEQKEDAKKKERVLLLVSGFSGAGKDSVVEGLIKNDNRLGLVRTCTTRERRLEENINNDPHIRLSDEEFQDALKGGDVVEWVEYAGNHYCTLTSVFEKAFENYEIPVLRIDPKGSHFYSEMWRNGEWLFEKVNLIYAFVVPPSVEVLRERLMSRSNDQAFVDKRIAKLEVDLPYVNEAEYIVINETDELEAAIDDLMDLIPA